MKGKMLDKKIEIGIFHGKPNFHRTFRWMAAMLRRGYPLPDIIETLSELPGGSSAWMRRAFSRVREGASLEEAMCRGKGKPAPAIYRAFIETGEKNNILPQSISIACEIEDPKRLEIVMLNIEILLYYLGFGLFAFLAIIFVMLMKIIPVFANLFSDIGHTLPSSTLLLMNFAQWFRTYFYTFIAVPAIVIPICYRLWKKSGPRIFDKFPILGKAAKYSSQWKLAYGMGSLMKHGVAVDAALDTMGGALNIPSLSQAAERVRANLQEGKNLSEILKYDAAVPDGVKWAVALGEARGDVPGALIRLGEVYREREAYLLGRISSAIEIALIFTLSIIIGMAVIPMYLPLFSISVL